MICIVDFSPTTLFSQQQVSRLWRRILLLMPIEVIQAEKGVLARLHFQAFTKTHGTICVHLQRRDVTPGLRPVLHQPLQVWRCRARRDCPKVKLSITKCTLMVNACGWTAQVKSMCGKHYIIYRPKSRTEKQRECRYLEIENQKQSKVLEILSNRPVITFHYIMCSSTLLIAQAWFCQNREVPYLSTSVV